MKTLNHIFLVVFCGGLLLCPTAHAQQHVAVGLTHDTPRPQVMLKFIDEGVIFPEGVTVYRSVDRQRWEKFTAKPQKMGDYAPSPEELAADTLLGQYMEIARLLTSAKQEGATLLVVLLKSLQSLPFARCLGIAYTDTQAVEGQTYYYRVCRVVRGKELELETTAPIIVKPFSPDLAPDSVKILAKDGEVTVTWRHEPTRYWGVNVYRNSSVDSAYRLVNERPLVPSTRVDTSGKEGYAPEFYADRTVDNSMVYRYQLAGIDFFGRETQWSEPVEARPRDKTPPIPPYNLMGEADKLAVHLKWDNRIQSDDMWGHYVYRGSSYYTAFERVSALLPATDSTFTDTVKESGNIYYYVSAVDFAENEGKTPRVMVQVPDVFPPAKPHVISTVADSGIIKITWRKNTEKDLMGYRLYRNSEGVKSSAYVLINPTPITDTVFTDKLPFVAKNYFYYRLCAIDNAYNVSEPADVVYAKMPDVAPPQQPFIKQVQQADNGLLVEWLPNIDNDLMGYHVYRFELDRPVDEAVQLNASLLHPRQTRFTDRFAAPNQTYKYFLTATDSSGNTSARSSFYGAVWVKDEGSAAPVSQLKAAYSKRKKEVTLRWEVQPENADEYKGCIVYRRVGNGNFTPLNTLTKTQKYKDSELTKGERYHYQVRSYTAGGHTERSLTVEVNVE
jgi:fibronectin type 3 domain-containing protein